MNVDFEPVLSALFSNLVASAAFSFTATATAKSAVLADADLAFDNLFVGLPVFGPGLPKNAVIQAFDPVADTVTLSAPVATAGEGPFTTGFLTTGRRTAHWSQVTAQPALFLRHIGTVDEYDHQQFFSRTTLECEVWIYANAGQDPNAAPDVMLNILDQLVRSSFTPDGDYGDPRYTIGGLAYWCRIEGRSDYSPGDQGGQAIARIPVRITLP